MEKAAGSGLYQYDTQSLPWILTVNSSKVPITDAKVRDVLPEGSTVELITVKKGSMTLETVQIDSSGNASINDGSNTIKFKVAGPVGDSKSGTLEIDFGPRTIEDQYTFSFGTVFEESYRKQEFTNEKLEKRVVNYSEFVEPSTVNNVKVVGNRSATGKITYPAFEKQGEYFTVTKDTDVDYGASYINWSIAFNRYAVNMSGAVFRDSFSDKPFYYLDSENITIYELAPTKNDLWKTKGTALNIEDFSPVITSEIFELTIPDKYKNTPLRIDFSTYLVGKAGDKVYPASMTNQASVSTKDDGDIDIEKVRAKNAEIFSYNDFATSSRAAQIRVKKYSSTKSKQTGEPFIPLQNAIFNLTQMDMVNGEWVRGAKVKVKNTAANGELVFMFIKKDTLYLLEETVAPKGYQKAEPQYIWFRKSSPAPDDLNFQVIEVDPSLTEKALIITDEILTSSDGIKGGNIPIRQQTPDGNPLKGVEYILTPVDYNSELPEIRIETGSPGFEDEIIFTGLEPNVRYILTQKTPEGIIENEVTSWEVSVEYDPESGSVVVKAPDTLPFEKDHFVVTNEYITSKVSLDGVFKENGETTMVPGAVFTIYSGDEKVGYFVWDENTKKYVPSLNNDAGLARNKNGSFFIQPNGMLPGEYKFVLSSPPEGYVENANWVSLIIPIDGTDVNLDVASGREYVFEKKTKPIDPDPGGPDPGGPDPGGPDPGGPDPGGPDPGGPDPGGPSVPGSKSEVHPDSKGSSTPDKDSSITPKDDQKTIKPEEDTTEMDDGQVFHDEKEDSENPDTGGPQSYDTDKNVRFGTFILISCILACTTFIYRLHRKRR